LPHLAHSDRLTEKSLRAGLVSSAAAAGPVLAASLEPAAVVAVFLSSAPTRLTGMTTDEGVLAPVLDLAESDGVDDVGC